MKQKKQFPKRYLSIWVALILVLATFFIGRSFNTKVQTSAPNYVTNFDDDRIATGYWENVFVATVKNKKFFDETDAWIYSTSYDIEVVYNIKWTLWKLDVVTQYGWKDIIGTTHIIDWAWMLEVWATYLLITRGDQLKLLDHSNGQKLLTKNNITDLKTAQSFIRENADIKQARIAYQNEVLFDESIRIGTWKNAYQILSASEIDDFKNFETGFLE